MEFKFRHGENRSTSTLPSQQRPLPTVPLVSGHLYRGGFPGIIPAPRMYSTLGDETLRRELEREQIRREMEKEEIRREILAGEMARRLELEEEVRRELASERALKMPMHRMEGIGYGERVSLSMIPGTRLKNSHNDNNICGGPQPQLPPKVDITQFYKQTPNETLINREKRVILPKPNIALFTAKCKEMLDDDISGVKHKEVVDVNLGGVKRKLKTQVDDKHSGSSLEKKPKKQWICELCHIVTTGEKGLNDHFQGKKHKLKAESLTTPKKGKSTKTTLSWKSNWCVKSTVTMNSGLDDARQNGETLQTEMNPADKDKLELVKKDLTVEKSHDLGGTDKENEATSETNASITRKKFSFYCAFCQVRTYSEVVMQSHKSGKKHLANVRKLSSNNSAGACAAANSE